MWISNCLKTLEAGFPDKDKALDWKRFSIGILSLDRLEFVSLFCLVSKHLSSKGLVFSFPYSHPPTLNSPCTVFVIEYSQYVFCIQNIYVQNIWRTYYAKMWYIEPARNAWCNTVSHNAMCLIWTFSVENKSPEIHQIKNKIINLDSFCWIAKRHFNTKLERKGKLSHFKAYATCWINHTTQHFLTY